MYILLQLLLDMLMCLICRLKSTTLEREVRAGWDNREEEDREEGEGRNVQQGEGENQRGLC